MSEIKIPFNEWSRRRLWKKRCTSRNKKYGKIGDTFISCNESIISTDSKPLVKYEITYIEKLSLGFVAEHLYELEGADSSEGFIKVWEDIHPVIGFVPEQKVWVHVFKEVERTEKEVK